MAASRCTPRTLRLLAPLVGLLVLLPLLEGNAAFRLPLKYDGDAWVENRGEHGHALLVERSRTDRARCRRCGGTIEKDSIRIGLPIPDSRGGDNGVITGWQHLRCTRVSEGECPSLACAAYGWLSVSEHDREEIQATVRQEADEMGMGKTIQMITLMLAHKGDAEKHGWPHKSGQAATLVVCPVSAVSQWHSEILKWTLPGSLSVLLYHGPNRHEATAEVLSRYDVVVTSYSVIEAEWRRTEAVKKIKCAYCAKAFLPRTLVMHLRYFCGPDAKRTQGQGKREVGGGRMRGLRKAMRTMGIKTGGGEGATPTPGNLYREIMAANSEGAGLQGIDEDDLREMDEEWWSAKGGGKGSDDSGEGATSGQEDGGVEPEGKEGGAGEEVLREGGGGDAGEVSLALQEAIKAAEMAEEVEGEAGGSALHQLEWDRIVLDECHKIKSRNTGTSKAAFALKGRKKWCLSGTPLQNRVGDLYSLVRFLEFHPWASYLCSKSGCDCQSFEYRFGPKMRRCRECGHSPMMHYSHFNKYILNPIKRFGNVGEGRRAMRRLRRDVLGAILLRRTKEERQSDLSLPERSISLTRLPLSEAETDFYKSVHSRSASQFDAYVAKGTLQHNYAHVFELLSRLRQACNHPYLVIHDPAAPPKRPLEPCGLCSLAIPRNESVQTLCRHSFHHACMATHIRTGGGGGLTGAQCPRCFQPLSVDMRPGGAGFRGRGGRGKRGILGFLDPENFESSTKLDGVVAGVKEMLAKGSKNKGIVFSQFTRMLDLIGYRLLREGISSVRVTGDMSRAQRDSSLNAFRNATGGVGVILISLKAGGEGLNLQAANHVFVVDPWWNPASEMQAIDRTHRIGQTQEVQAVRFITSDTIEEKIIELQEKKQLIISGTIDKQHDAIAQLTMEDMRFLFHR